MLSVATSVAEEQQVFDAHNIDTIDLERIPDGKTFRWFGRYDYDLNVAHTLDTHLNVFADFQPKLSETSKKRAWSFWQTFSRTCSEMFASK